MIDAIIRKSISDTYLAKLLDEARDYAQVYVLARQRQKGCDGMGEFATMKDEFRGVIEKVIQYCKAKKYIAVDISYDIDSIADEIVKVKELL